MTAFKPPAYYRNQETDQESNKEDTVNNEPPEKMFMKKIWPRSVVRLKKNLPKRQEKEKIIKMSQI